MKELKFIRDNDLQPENYKEFFQALCKRVINKPENVVIKEALGFPFTPEAAKTYKPNLVEIFKVISHYKLEFKVDLKVLFEAKPEKEVKVKTEMDEQRELITGPELKGIAAHKIVIVDQGHKIEIKNLPDFEI